MFLAISRISSAPVPDDVVALVHLAAARSTRAAKSTADLVALVTLFDLVDGARRLLSN